MAMRVNRNFPNNLNVIWVVQSPLAKIFRLTRRATRDYQLAPSFPGKRGVGHRHERGRGCGGRDSVGAQGDRRAGPFGFVSEAGAQDERRYSRTAKPCGPGIRC